jgi:hypothetical protein
MAKPWRLWLAFPLAPLLGCAVCSVALSAVLNGHVTWLNLVPTVELSYVVALAASLVFAVPSYLFLRRRGPVQLWHCVCAGAVIGLVGGLGGAIFGLTSGFFFWLIGLWRNNSATPCQSLAH